ncbi:MAG: DEAD/DEAH box helicase [bacterium]|nr:DEAD/DEAH box helicase [bacterium]
MAQYQSSRSSGRGTSTKRFSSGSSHFGTRSGSKSSATTSSASFSSSGAKTSYGGSKPSYGSNSGGKPFVGGRSSSRPSFGAFGGSRRRKPAVKKKKFGDYIDPALFIKKASTSTPIVPVVITHAFADFGLCKELNQNLARKRFTIPTPVQDHGIPVVMEGKDIIGLANTGTGKTGAFLLPLIHKVFKDPSQRVLIVAPTRELAVQIDDDFRSFSYGMRIFSAVCVGGTSMHKQIFNLKRNPHFLIGTPGRLKDLATRKCVQFSTFNNVVLDEVDRMLDMGFIEPITEMLAQLPKVRQTLFFSATLPPRIGALTSQFLSDPTTIEIRSGVTADSVDQDVIRVKDKSMKFEELKKLLKQPELSKVLIFSETKRDVERLSRDLQAQGFKADSIHGDKKQQQRQRALGLFRDNRVKILVATDVAARGLDIKDITHVINYTIPNTHNDYIHRIGRTGRGSSKGIALTFVD